MDEFKEALKIELEPANDVFNFKLWCPRCKSDLSADDRLSKGLSSESFSQYASARSRSSSASSYTELASLSSEIIPERPPIRRFSTQSNQSKSPSLVISPRFSSTRRKSVREKRTTELARPRKASSAILSRSLSRQQSMRKGADKSSSPSTDSRSKTTTASNSTTVSIAKCSLPNLEQYNVETYLKKNQQTGSIKQLTVIRYNERRQAEGARQSVKQDDLPNDHQDGHPNGQ